MLLHHSPRHPPSPSDDTTSCSIVASWIIAAHTCRRQPLSYYCEEIAGMQIGAGRSLCLLHCMHINWLIREDVVGDEDAAVVCWGAVSH